MPDHGVKANGELLIHFISFFFPGVFCSNDTHCRLGKTMFCLLHPVYRLLLLALSVLKGTRDHCHGVGNRTPTTNFAIWDWVLSERS